MNQIDPKSQPHKVVTIIQARMSSTRLPGKALQEIEGHPMLWHVVNRASRSSCTDQVVIATTTSAADNVIDAFCKEEGIPCFRGSEDDVLDRYYQAARKFGADTIVRITADCPLLNWGVIDQTIQKYLNGGFDYVSNTLQYTYPDGLDTEVFSFSSLERAWKEAKKPSEREHVTPYLKVSGKFRTSNVESTTDLSSLNYHWSVDTAQDLNFAREVFAHFKDKSDFRFEEIVELLERKPKLRSINGGQTLNEGYYKTLFQQARAGAAPKRPVTKSLALLERSKHVIPGCAQTFSKGPQQFVQGISPVFLQKGKGCRVWDADGNEYIDYIQGLLPNILGYANEEVNRAVSDQTNEGHSFSLPHPLEITLAERLTRLIPSAEMVRFGKNGSDATAGAVRAARAFTGRDRIAVCGYHGWQDWYIGSTTRNNGVPKAVRDLTHTFNYNDPKSLETLFNTHPKEFAAVVMEPVNFVEPLPFFLESVKKLAHDNGALLIFDEICSGFHLGLGGAQKRLGVTPDLSCFGKAMGNGFPISCIVGRKDVMQIFEDIFFSFTAAGDVSAMAAALKVLDILEHTDALKKMEANGKTLQDGFNSLSKEAGLNDRIYATGFPQWSLLKFKDAELKDSLLVRSLFSQEAVKRGILLLVTHNLTSAHDGSAIQKTLEAYAEIFKTLKVWLDPSSKKNPAEYLEGKMIEPVFRVR